MAVITQAFAVGTAGSIARVSSVERVVNDLYTLQNGNIEAGNIAASGVTESAVADQVRGYIALSAEVFG